MIRLARLTKAQHRALHADLRDGLHRTEAARKYHITTQAVRYHQIGCAASEAKFAENDDAMRLDPFLHLRVHLRIEQGADDDALMAEFGLIWTLIRYHRNQHCDYLLPLPNLTQTKAPQALRSKPKEGPPMTENAMIRERVRTGDDLHRIAEELDVPFNRVRAVKAGLAKKRVTVEVITGSVEPAEPVKEISQAPLSGVAPVVHPDYDADHVIRELEDKRAVLTAVFEAAVSDMQVALDHQLDAIDTTIALLTGGPA